MTTGICERREEEQSKANIENIKRVHRLIIPELMSCGVTEEQSNSIIMAIREGKIPALSIDYRWKSNSCSVSSLPQISDDSEQPLMKQREIDRKIQRLLDRMERMQFRRIR